MKLYFKFSNICVRCSIYECVCLRLGAAAGNRFRLLSSSHTAASAVSMSRQQHNGKYKAVIFDMGGVLVPGPGGVFNGELAIFSLPNFLFFCHIKL